jgi:O-antigen/teichoic acid export membrane protein
VGVRVEATNPDLGSRTATGLSWQLLASFVRVFASFAFGVALARLLPPEDFGIVGIAFIVTGFVYILTDLGLTPALVQRREVNEAHVRVCHTVAMTAGVLMTVLVYAGAGSVADFFNEPRVEGVLQVLAFASLLSSFGATSGALLLRRLAFRTTVRIELIASVLGYGVVAVVMAARGSGYWSLVGGALAQAALSSVLSYAAVRHALRPLASAGEFKDLLGFSTGMALTSLINFFAVKGDYFIVGRMMNVASLGFYTRAYTLMELPQVVFGSALSRVLFPAAARVQDDADRFRRAYLAVFSISFAIALPVSLCLAILAPEVVLVLFGDVWKPVVPLLQILCLFGAFRMTYNTASAFLRARGKIVPLLLSTIVYGALVLGGGVWAASMAGVQGVAWTVGGAITVMWLLVVGAANRAADVPLPQFARELMLAALPGLAVSFGLLGLVAGMRAVEIPALLVLAVSGVAFTLALSAALLFHVRRLDHPGINTLLERVTRSAARVWRRLGRFVPRATL